MKTLLTELLDPYNPLLLECDGLTTVLHTALVEAAIPHSVYQGTVYSSAVNRSIPWHRWLEVPTDEGVYRVDYRARMWLCPGEVREDVPHGVFRREEYPHTQYQGSALTIPAANAQELAVLLDHRCGTFIPFSYKVRHADDVLAELMKDTKAEIIECRYTPYAHGRPAWCRFGKEGLASTWRDRYMLLSAEKDERGRDLNFLGNKNYKIPGAPIKLVDEERGLQALLIRLHLQRTLIGVCGCVTYRTCHLHTIAQKLASQLPTLPLRVFYPVSD